jgi:hypothetical protein
MPLRSFCVGCLRPVIETPGVDLDWMSEAQLEALYAGLVRIAEVSPSELQALVQSLVARVEAPFEAGYG